MRQDTCIPVPLLFLTTPSGENMLQVCQSTTLSLVEPGRQRQASYPKLLLHNTLTITRFWYKNTSPQQLGHATSYNTKTLNTSASLRVFPYKLYTMHLHRLEGWLVRNQDSRSLNVIHHHKSTFIFNTGNSPVTICLYSRNYFHYRLNSHLKNGVI